MRALHKLLLLDVHAEWRAQCKKLEIRSYPSVILLDGEGRERHRNLGFQKPEGMLKWLEGRK